MNKREPLTELTSLLALAVPGTPKYEQLRNALATVIADGRWKPGAQVPSEDALVAATALSLGTVQRALKLLADDGLVVRAHGKGTFVADEHRPMNAPFIHCRFFDDERVRYLPIYSTVIGRHDAKGDGEWRVHLRGQKVVRIDRVFSIADEFLLFTHLYIDAAHLPSLAAKPLAQLHGANFKDLIRQERRLPLTRFAENLSVAVFPPYICEAIQAKKGTAGAILEIVATDADDTALYFQDLYIPPNKRRLFVA